MALPKLAPSKSKKEFLRHLGLSEDNEAVRRVYNMMKDEAVAGLQRISQTPHNLTVAGSVPQPPYSSNQITETAMHQEVLRIYSLASPMTRPIYDLGRFRDGPNEDNWVIRWCLWHVFRYRDNRNRRPRSSPSESPPADPQSRDGSEASGRAGEYWDPVRNA
ncbi:hypothetical protein W97_08363 [Coniosporium apollinis CBS 100218]|uniref:Uncharacterized protein n=1 Tax=Coniosporium apollinis (strain CBS 100218) TaxID=1168221 RepID=R7Z4F0_CONA1|nr:uncharacterized protein W97_08363 [Coniosporium apollinis CBS 100218]EON69050.1 hypothetical protein W97_08363 [Coniosporium apollinis CBS 100218]